MGIGEAQTTSVTVTGGSLVTKRRVEYVQVFKLSLLILTGKACITLRALLSRSPTTTVVSQP